MRQMVLEISHFQVRNLSKMGVGFQPHFSLNYDVTDAKLCRLLECSKGLLLHFKFLCYDNHNDCLLLKKQKVYCLSKCFTKNNLKQYSLLLQAVSFFEEKLVIHSSCCEKTEVFRFWTKTNYSHFSCHSNEIWNQVKFLYLLLTAWKISKDSWDITLSFLLSCDVILKWKWGKKSTNIHLAQVVDFRISREPFVALKSVMAHFFAFFTLFHLSSTFFDKSFPLTNFK